MKKCVITKKELQSCTSELHAKVLIADKLREQGFSVTDDGIISEPHTRAVDHEDGNLIFEGGGDDLGRSKGTPQMPGDSDPQGVSGITTGRLSSKSANTSVSAPRGVGRENESAGS